MDEVQVQVPRRGLRYGGQVLSLPDGRQPDTCPLPGAPSQRGCRTRSPMSPAPYHRVTEGPLGNSTCQWGRSTLYSGRPLAARRAQCQGAGCASPPNIHPCTNPWAAFSQPIRRTTTISGTRRPHSLPGPTACRGRLQPVPFFSCLSLSR